MWDGGRQVTQKNLPEGSRGGGIGFSGSVFTGREFSGGISSPWHTSDETGGHGHGGWDSQSLTPSMGLVCTRHSGRSRGTSHCGSCRHGRHAGCAGPCRGPSAEPSFAEHSQGRRAAVCMSFVQQRGPSSSPSVPDTNFPILFLPNPWSSAKPLTTAHEWSHDHASGNFFSQSEQPGALPSPAHREGPPQPWPLEVWRGLLGCICLLLGGACTSCGVTCKPGPGFLLLHQNVIIWNIPEMIGADC